MYNISYFPKLNYREESRYNTNILTLLRFNSSNEMLEHLLTEVIQLISDIVNFLY